MPFCISLRASGLLRVTISPILYLPDLIIFILIMYPLKPSLKRARAKTLRYGVPIPVTDLNGFVRVSSASTRFSTRTNVKFRSNADWLATVASVEVST